MTIDRMQFCYVPAGQFWMGDDMINLARPMRRFDLPHYWISRYPVTTAQWRQYIAESGVEPMDPNCLKGDGNSPVAWVNWGEALAFSGWLQSHWAVHLQAVWRVCLPSEAEWEKAARGGTSILRNAHIATILDLGTARDLSNTTNLAPQRSYPWGNEWDAECANISHENATEPERGMTFIDRVSSVGAFPMGRSACGTEDLVGNVWEWTRSLWGMTDARPDFNYPYRDAIDRRENLHAAPEVLRVVRGGVLANRHLAAHCAFRYRSHIAERRHDLGFRVVLCTSASHP